IQISMLLALVVMAYCLFIAPQHAAWYVAYVVLFNMLVGPVFSAGSVTSERERATLDLLLVTLITPWQMLWGKLFSGLRVSSVLTSFLMWPMFLALLMPLDFWHNIPTMIGYFGIVAVTALTTSLTALFCSTLFRKSSTALMATYMITTVLFMAPVAADVFVRAFVPDSPAAPVVEALQVTSPFSAAFNLPLETDKGGNLAYAHVMVFWGHLAFYLLYNGGLLAVVTWLFQARWRVSE
ncbi:MAG: ABC transporter permease subunit, partial [Planctomycetales bacterium]|nr:ABC transporter permease subunit [Planctomycetales bacterium]